MKIPLPARAALACLCALSATAIGQPATGQKPPLPSPATEIQATTDEQVIADLVLANHILAQKGVLDGFGHISARSIRNPHHYYMSRSLAPALVTAADIMEFDENSRPVDPQGRQMYSERFIHGEIYRARADVRAVVHSHAPDVLPFTVTSAPFQALVHTSAFLGAEPAPVFDSRTAPGGDFTMLVTDRLRGEGVAKALGKRAVVLMRGHGLAVTAPNVRQMVLRAIYTQLNARVEIEALKLGTPNFLDAREAQRYDPADRPWNIWVKEAEDAAKPR